MTRSYRHWTDEEKAAAFDMKARGASITAIARALGRSHSSVTNRLSDTYSQGRTCSGCAKPIMNTAKTGQCRTCFTVAMNKAPETSIKRSEAFARRMADPAKRAVVIATAKANGLRALANPEARAKMVENGRKIARAYLQSPEVLAKLNSPELRERRARTISEMRMAWCPVEYRDLYRELTGSGIRAPEARQMVRDQIARDEARLSPFERQMKALERGAKLVANDVRGLHETRDHGEARWSVGR